MRRPRRAQPVAPARVAQVMTQLQKMRPDARAEPAAE